MSSEIRTQNKKKQPPPLMITSLPHDIIVDILAHVSRWDYPTLSLVSKHFRSLVSSSELYARRSLLGYTEACIYSVLSKSDPGRSHLYVLRRRLKGNNNSSSFVQIASLPSQASYVSVGSKIYVSGITSTTNSYSIDCRSHSVQPFSEIPHGPKAKRIVDVIDKKIYVIMGECNLMDEKMVMMVFNTETQTWEPEMTTKPSIELNRLWYPCVVIGDKMYVRDSHSEESFIYEPKEDKWELDEMLNSYKWFRGCVLDDVLYYYDSLENKLRAYESKQKCWKVVKGLDGFLPHIAYPWSDTVSCGRKLAVFFITDENWETRRDIWCADITIERRQEGEIWGKVESYDVVFSSKFSFIKTLVVMI